MKELEIKEEQEELISVRKDEDFSERERLPSYSFSSKNYEFDLDEIFSPDYNTGEHSSEENFLLHCRSLDNLARRFKTDISEGLDSDDFDDFNWRRSKYGENKFNLIKHKKNSFCAHFKKYIFDDASIILFLSALTLSSTYIFQVKSNSGEEKMTGIPKSISEKLCDLLGRFSHFFEGLIIILAVLFTALINSLFKYCEVDTYTMIDKKIKPKNINAIRKGREVLLPFEEICVGDLIKIKKGNTVFVDGFIVKGRLVMSELFSVENESIKQPNFENKMGKYITPFIFSGSFCKEGEGTIMVAAIGENTFINKLMESNKNDFLEDFDITEYSSEESDKIFYKSTMQKEANNLSLKIQSFAFLFSIILLSFVLLKEIFISIIYSEQILRTTFLNTLINTLTISAIIMVFSNCDVWAIGIILLLNFLRHELRKEETFIRDPSKIEVLGKVSTIIADKEGVLDTGEKKFESLYIDGNYFKFEENNTLSIKDERLFEKVDDKLQLYLSKNISSEDGEIDLSTFITVEDPTERLFYKYLMKNNYDFNTMDDPLEYSLAEVNGQPVIYVFNSQNGQASFPIRINTNRNIQSDGNISIGEYTANIFYNSNELKYILFIKGNSNALEHLCSTYETLDDDIFEYDESKRDQIKSLMKYFGGNGSKVLLFGFREISTKEMDTAIKKYGDGTPEFFNSLIHDITFSFMLSIKDNCQKNIPESIKKINDLGTKIIMTTKESVEDAVSFAADIGIFPSSVDASSDYNIKNINKVFNEIQDKFEDKNNPNTIPLSVLDKEESNTTISRGIQKNKKLLRQEYMERNKIIALDSYYFRRLSGGLKKSYNNRGELEVSLRNEECFKLATKNLQILSRVTEEDKFLLAFGFNTLKQNSLFIGQENLIFPYIKRNYIIDAFIKSFVGVYSQKNDLNDPCDIVIKNFSKLPSVLSISKSVYVIMWKMFQFLLTSYLLIGEFILFSIIYMHDFPITGFTLIWIFFIVNIFGCYSLASMITEDPKSDIKNIHEINEIQNESHSNIIFQMIYQLIAFPLIIYFTPNIFKVANDRNLYHIYNWEHLRLGLEENGYHFTILYEILVFSILFILIECRSTFKKEMASFKGLLTNEKFIRSIIFIIVIQIGLVAFGGRFLFSEKILRVRRLTIKDHLLCLGIGFISFLIGFGKKINGE